MFVCVCVCESVHVHVLVCVCTDPDQLFLQRLLGGLRAAVQQGALFTHTLSQPLYPAPLYAQQLAGLPHTHTHTHTPICARKCT
jgi:hypothetical protein